MPTTEIKPHNIRARYNVTTEYAKLACALGGMSMSDAIVLPHEMGEGKDREVQVLLADRWRKVDCAWGMRSVS